MFDDPHLRNQPLRNQPPWALALAALLLLAWGGAATADPPSLRLPLDCEPGQTCFIQAHVDRDPGSGATDYMCGGLTRNGHTGTDIAVIDAAAMHRGTKVLAAAAGTVTGMRDGVPDRSVEEMGTKSVDAVECGNGVVINHGDGWETQYCHLRRGSVKVRSKDRVAAGDVIGLVGLSGLTGFPHVHLEVRRFGKPIDPFDGEINDRVCGGATTSLWQDAPPYVPTGLIDAGFASRPPDQTAAESGALNESPIRRDAEALVFWVRLFGVEAQDRPHLRLLRPDGGTMVEVRADPINRHKERYFQFAGKKRVGPTWTPGVYRGEFRLLRGTDEKVVVSATREVQVR
jgi:hypothetical protein